MRFATGLAVLGLALVACSQRTAPEDALSAEERARPRPVTAAAPEPEGVPRDPRAQTIRGTIVRAVGAPAPAGAALFVLVRPAGVESGPPLAVQRLAPDSFPLAFAIGPADAMLPGTTFPARVTVEARLDADGDAGTTGPGDARGRADGVAPGAAGVTLVLESP